MTHQYQSGDEIEVNNWNGTSYQWQGNGRKYIGTSSDNRIVYETQNGSISHAPERSVRPIPKVRKGWINIYPSKIHPCLLGQCFDTKEDAIQKSAGQAIDTIEIEWKETK